MAADTFVHMVQNTEWYQTTAGWIAFLVSTVGGGGAIAVFVSKFVADRSLEKHKAELSQETERLKGSLSTELERLKGVITRETESYKSKLKRIEIIQNRELDAVVEFIRVAQTIYPKRFTEEDDYYEACADLVSRFDQIHKQIDLYLTAHGLFLSDGSSQIVRDCAHIAEEHQFDVVTPDDEASSKAVESAEKFLELVREAEARMVKDVRVS